MTKPKLIGIALLMLAAGPFACAIRYKNSPGPPPADPSPIKPYGAVPWRDLPVLYSGDTAATAGPSARASSTAATSAAASAGPPTAVASAAATVVPLDALTMTAQLGVLPPPPPPPPPPLRPSAKRVTEDSASPHPPPAKPSASPSAPPPTPPQTSAGEPTCEQLVAKMGRILHGSGAQPLPPEQAQKMLDECRQAKQKAPAEWRTCTECMLKIDEAKPDLKACRTPCEAMEKKARGGS